MQPVKFLKFLRQLGVLIQRNLQLIWNDKLLLASLALQSPFMVLVVKLTADPNCFTSNLVNIGSRTALFILAAMATFMGTLNSYREICKEREIILREASVGVSLQAVVLSKAAVLLLVEIAQAAILALGFVSIVHVPQNHLLLETDMEIFVTLLLTMFSSSCVGLLISALLTAAYLFPPLCRAFFPGQDFPARSRVREPLLLVLSLALFAAASLILGLLSGITVPVMEHITGSIL